MHLKRSRFAVLLLLLTGCAGLIGVPDLTFEEDDTSDDGGLDGSSSGNATDGQVGTDGTTVTDARADVTTDAHADAGIDANVDAADADAGIDADVDAATCDLTKVDTDKNNCGTCGHVCLDDGACLAGRCEATVVATIANANLAYLVEHGDYLYASSTSSFSPNPIAGVWRVHKTTGAKDLLLNTWRIDDLVVLGNKLYFITGDDPYHEDSPGHVDDWGGLWECDLSTNAPCTPRLLQGIEDAVGITAGNGKIYFAEEGLDAIRSYDPALDKSANGGDDAGFDAGSAFATVGTHPNIRYNWRLFADGSDVYSLLAIYDHPQLVKLNAAGTDVTKISGYDWVFAAPGMLRGNATDVFFTVQDGDEYVTTGGLVRRVSRSNPSSTCDYAGGPVTDGTKSIERPRGIYIDDQRVYWANRGKWDGSGGSIATCDLAGCCAEANILWSDTGSPTAVVGDAKYIYWSDSDTGIIRKVSKP